MNKYIKRITFIIITIIMIIGFNVYADDDYYLQSEGAQIFIEIPIHKTNKNDKPLEGAVFTLKDLNNNVSYTSTDEKDGDYLIEIRKDSVGFANKRIDNDNIENRVIDRTGEDEVLSEVIDLLPKKYSDVIRKAETPEDLSRMFDLPSKSYTYSERHYAFTFYVPLKVEETKVPSGYKAKSIIIPALAYIDFDSGLIGASLLCLPGSGLYPPLNTSIYFEYNEETDYEKIFDNINSKISSIDSDQEFISIFEENGAIINKYCLQTASPEVIVPTHEVPGPTHYEQRFDDEILQNLCPIHLVDEKEDIIVNPETYGPITIVILLVLSSIGLMIIRRTKKEA